MIVALVGAYQGLSTRGGAAGVGKSTTGAVVNSIILIFIANFILSLVLFGGASGVANKVYARLDDID